MRNEAIQRIERRTDAELSVHWASCLEFGLSDHSPDAHAAVNESVATYFSRLRSLPDPAKSEDIMGLVRALFAELDKISAQFGEGLLETDERELLVTPIVDAAEAAGLNLDEFANRDPTEGIRNF